MSQTPGLGELAWLVYEIVSDDDHTQAALTVYSHDQEQEARDHASKCLGGLLLARVERNAG